MKQQLHYAWYRMHTTDVSDKAKCIGHESHYSVSFITCSTVSIKVIFVTLLLHIFHHLRLGHIAQWSKHSGAM